MEIFQFDAIMKLLKNANHAASCDDIIISISALFNEFN